MLLRRRGAAAAVIALLAILVALHHLGDGRMDGGSMHQGDGMAALAMCVAVVASLGVWSVARRPRVHPLLRRWKNEVVRPATTVRADPDRARARAGPDGSVVLRL